MIFFCIVPFILSFSFDYGLRRVFKKILREIKGLIVGEKKFFFFSISIRIRILCFGGHVAQMRILLSCCNCVNDGSIICFWLFCWKCV